VSVLIVDYGTLRSLSCSLCAKERLSTFVGQFESNSSPGPGIVVEQTSGDHWKNSDSEYPAEGGYRRGWLQTERWLVIEAFHKSFWDICILKLSPPRRA